MKDGTKKQLHEVKVGDSIMPLYRKKNNLGYEQVLDLEDNQYIFTHKAVLMTDYCHEKGKVIHHKDFDKNNNNPDKFICLITKPVYQDNKSIQVLFYTFSEVNNIIIYFCSSTEKNINHSDRRQQIY